MDSNFFKEYEDYSNAISKLISDSYKESVDAFIEMHKRHSEILSERAKVALKTLAYYGWYIPSMEHYISYPSDLAEQLNNNNEDYVDNEMKQMIKKNFVKLCNNILEKNPNRINILKQAFKAHKSKKYALSVPVFLSQADGICKEITNFGLYFKNNNVPLTKVYVDNLENNSLLGYLEPLRVVLPIIFSEKYLDEKMKFNRHKILHGEDYSYDSETISLKAFSLLSYINTFLHK